MAILQAQVYSNALKRTVPLSVALPADGYGELPPLRPLPVLYLLHGVNGSQLDWLTSTRVARYASAKGLCVVMPSGENSFYVDNAATGVRWGAFIGEELPMLCRRMFPLSDRREQTYLGGLSMGGYGALVNGLTHPDTFGAIMGFSCALLTDMLRDAPAGALIAAYPASYYAAMLGPTDALAGGRGDCDALVRRLVAERSAAACPRMLLRCGLSDMLLPANRRYHELLTSLGVAHDFETEPGDHEWEFWDRSIKRALEWL